MTKSRDLLQEWKERVSWLKFNLHRPTDKVFNDAIRTEQVLRAFFNPSDYTITRNGIDESNFLVYLLVSKHEKDIRLLNEMAELIEYAQQNKQKVALKSNSNTVDHAGLSKALFEVYINKFLNDKSIATVDNASYTDGNGRIKPLDNYFEFNGQSYLVECLRVADSDSLSLMQLSDRLMHVLFANKITPDQAYRGHIGIKATKSIAMHIDAAKHKVVDMFLKYLAAFNDVKDNTISIPAKFTSDGYDIDIMPFEMGTTHESEWEKGIYNNLITFQVQTDMNKPDGGKLIVSGNRVTTESDMNSRLFEKVRRKRQQHKDAVINKIFFVEIDSTFGVNPNNPIFSQVTNEKLDIVPYQKVIEKDENCLIAFVFKNVTDDAMNRQIRFLYNPKHQQLIDQMMS
jgi:hypothetical protein